MGFLGKKKVWSVGLAFCATLAALLSGYTISLRTNLMRGGWPLDAPIEWRIWEGFTDQNASIEDGSQPNWPFGRRLSGGLGSPSSPSSCWGPRLRRRWDSTGRTS
jgi:hypothetical protein